MSDAEAETSPEPRKAAVVAGSKKSGSGSALSNFLSIMDGYEAAHAEATTEVERLTAELAEARTKLAKVEAYKAIHDGKIPSDLFGEPAPRQRRASAPRAARGEISGKVLGLVREATNGISRADVIQALGMRGNKSGEASVSNALASLKKAGTIAHNPDGRYSMPA